MGLSDITGIFSRYFVIGFFLPSYISLVSLWLVASSEFVPDALEHYSQATQLLILGGVALVAAMLLSGLRGAVLRTFQGYLIAMRVGRVVLGPSHRRQLRKFDRLDAIRQDANQSRSARTQAAWLLDWYFPRNREDVLPTKLGNVTRAFERYSNNRWGLDGVTIWPRIHALVSPEERELLLSAETDLYTVLNGAVGAFIVGVCLAYDKAVNVSGPAWLWPLYAVPFVLAFGLYILALEPAGRQSEAVRSSFDLHRLELYQKLGLRSPRSFSDERDMARQVNQALLYGVPLKDDLWRDDKGDRSS